MRRLLAAATLAVLAAIAAGCISDTTSSGGSASGPAVAAGGNTKEVCVDARKVVSESGTKFGREFGKIMAAAAKGDTSANDTAAPTIKQVFTGWADGLRTQAAKADNADLKSALTTYADELDKIVANMKSYQDAKKADDLLDTPNIATATEQMNRLCG